MKGLFREGLDQTDSRMIPTPIPWKVHVAYPWRYGEDEARTLPHEKLFRFIEKSRVGSEVMGFTSIRNHWLRHLEGASPRSGVRIQIRLLESGQQDEVR